MDEYAIGAASCQGCGQVIPGAYDGQRLCEKCLRLGTPDERERATIVPIQRQFAREPVLDTEDRQAATTRLQQLRDAALDTDGLDDLPEPEPLISGLLYSDTTAWMIGKAGHAKSFVSLDQAACIATGNDWQEHAVQKGPVLYVVAEGAAGIRKRVRSWEESYGCRMYGVTFLPVAVQANEPADWQALIDYAGELTPVLIILDTQARVTVGMEENSAKDMGQFIHKLERLRIATRACVMTVHHKGRNGDHARGSSSMDGAGDTILEVARDGDIVTVKNVKQKHIEEHEDITLRLTPLGESAVLTTGYGSTDAKALAAMKTARTWWEQFRGDWASWSRALDAGVATKPTLGRHLNALRDRGLMDKDDKKGWRLTREPE